MKKSFLPLFLLFLSLAAYSQNRGGFSSKDLVGFDRKTAWNKALSKSAKPFEQKEYYEYLERQFVGAHRASAQVVKSTIPYSISSAANKTIINLSPSNAYCPNADFGSGNFSSWVGGTYGNSAAVNWNTFTPTWVPGIVTMGVNTPPQPAPPGFPLPPTQDRHTILTIPPTVNNPPTNCIGYDSIAVGMTHLSQIPFVPPTAGGVTCRLGNANPNYETENLAYTMNVSTSNAQFTYAYAVVLYDGTHGAGEQPFFKVTMKDQSGNPIAGCGQYQIDATMVSTDTSFHRASSWDSFSNTWTDGYTTGTTPNPSWFYYIYYKTWTTVGVDLTAYIGQNVTIEFQTADCIFGGHWGYAYIDASCGPTQALVNMCSGSTTQQVLGPPGYITYQWFGPNNPATVIAAPGGTNDTLFINNGVVGDTYYLIAVSANGCTTHVQSTLAFSTVSTPFVSSTPSCPGGTSGSATVYPTGSPSYVYSWVNSAGANVGNTQTATGLSPGSYTVHVSAPGCGAHDTVVTVSIAPPFTVYSSKNFCGSVAFLSVPTAGASNIHWYDASGTAVPAPAGTNDSLTVANPTNGQIYSVVYTASGCIDSLRIKLVQVAGGSLSHASIQNVCIGGVNGQAVVNLNTTFTPPYNYTMNGPTLNQTYTGVATTSYSLTGLAQGTYTINAFDGMCFYTDQFKVDTISVPVYLTVAPKSLCSNDSAFINYTFAGAAPTQCQLATSGCTSSSSFVVGPANASNSSFSYPTPFGNFYTKVKAQYIYTAAELTGAGISAGKLNSIAFNCTQINGAIAYPDFNIAIGCTNLSTYPSFPVQTDIISTGLSNVYSNASYNVVLGQNIFNFTQPYEWDGASNIVVEVCFEFPGVSNWTSNCVVDNTISAVYPSISVKTDTDPICAGYLPTGFYYAEADQMRPVATFGWCSSVATPAMYTYAISPMAGVINAPINPPAQTIIQPPATTTYTFTTTSVVGNCAKKDTFTISIIRPFNIVMPAATSLCTNAAANNITATFTDATTGLPTSIPAVWSGAGISANNGTGVATFDPMAAGIGTHTLVITAGGSCTRKDSVVYTVGLWQSGQITAIGPFCIYDAAVVVPSTTPGGVWSGPVSVTGLFTPSTAGVSSPFHVIKYVVNGGTICADSSSINVQVFDKPVVDFSTDTTDGCAPNVAIVFTSTVSPLGGTYSWDFGTGQTSASTIPQNVYANAGTYSPILTYTDVNGCVNTITKNGLITVHPWQSANIFASDSIFCVSDPSIQIQTSSPGGSWSGPVLGNGVFNPATAGVTSNLTPPYHTIKYTMNAGTACSDVDSIHMQVFNKPSVDFGTDVVTGCAPLTVNFVAYASPAGGSYHWSFGNGQSSTSANPVNDYTLAGTYSPKLTYIDPNGCKDSVKKTGYILVHPSPIPSFYANPNHTTILEPHIIFTNTTPGTNNIWLWNIADLKSATTQNTDYEFADPGQYLVTLVVTNSFGCKDSVSEYIKIDPDNMIYVPSGFTPNSDGLNDIFMAEAFGVFNTDGFSLKVFDRWGNKMFESGDIFKGWDGKAGGVTLGQDSYIYQVNYKDISGKSHTKSGQVSLIK
jgi:gliding motility-associated-like protein